MLRLLYKDDAGVCPSGKLKAQLDHVSTQLYHAALVTSDDVGVCPSGKLKAQLDHVSTQLYHAALIISQVFR